MNCTSITLVPKVPNPTLVKDFIPIASCSMLYKRISKILTARLQKVVHQVVDLAQSGFVPGLKQSLRKADQ